MDLQQLKGDVPWIDIEGGPGAGKSTALAAICEWCQNHGYKPYIVPEAARNLISSGLNPATDAFQVYVLKEIIHAVSIRMHAIRTHDIQKPVLIFDSGFARGQAYVSNSVFEQALASVGLNQVAARDIYDGVIFLDSAAVGAEAFYVNDEERPETIEQARIINELTLNAWIGTPHLRQIRNRPDQSFDQKIIQAKKALARILGVPEPLERERKFLLHDFDPSHLPNHTTPIDIVQTYLVGKSQAETERVRARGQHEQWLHFHTMKRFIKSGESAENDRLIHNGMYTNLLHRRNMSKLPIIKTRRCLTHGDHYFEQDSLHGHREGENLLEVEVHDLDETVDIPKFFGPYTEVTADPSYSMYNMADPV
jgi:CYTH domain-containing protein/predicted ATPase